MIQNLREVIEKQLGRLERPLRTKVSAAAEIEDTRAGMRRLLQSKFEQVRRLYDAGKGRCSSWWSRLSVLGLP